MQHITKPVIAIASGALLVSAMANAKEAELLVATLLVETEASVDQPLTSRRNRPILSGKIFPTRSVRLDSGIDSVTAAAVSAQGADLDAGATLYLVDRERGVYCAPIHNAGLAKSGPCLIDGDGDGRFETAAKGRSMAVSPEGLAFADNGKIMGVDMIQQAPLTTPVAYHDADMSRAVSAPTSLYWSSNFNKKKPGPVEVRFLFDASNDWAGSGLTSEAYSTVFEGSPVDVRIGGLTVTVTGITTKGELQYRISGKMAAEEMRFRFYDRKPTTIIFI